MKKARQNGQTPTPDDKPRSFIEEARRKQIIDAAVIVVAQHGYTQASISRIAQQAGISRGLISYHFRDKEELLEQTVKVTFAAISAAVLSKLDLAGSAPEILRGLILGSAEYGAAHRDQLRALDQIASNMQDAQGQHLLKLTDYEVVYTQLERLFKRGQQEGTFRAFDTRVMAVTHQAAMDTMFAYTYAYPETDVRQYAASLTDLLLHAVLA